MTIQRDAGIFKFLYNEVREHTESKKMDVDAPYTGTTVAVWNNNGVIHRDSQEVIIELMDGRDIWISVTPTGVVETSCIWDWCSRPLNGNYGKWVDGKYQLDTYMLERIAQHPNVRQVVVSRNHAYDGGFFLYTAK